MKKFKINLEGMHCMGCAKRVENALKPFKSLKDVNVSLEQKCVTASVKGELDQSVVKALEDCGFEVKSIDTLE